MTQIASTEVTAAVLRSTDLNELTVVTPSGTKLGAEGDGPSLAFGLGSWEGDYEGFAAYLASQV